MEHNIEKNIMYNRAYGIYRVFAALSTIFVFKFIKETRGMTLEEME